MSGQSDYDTRDLTRLTNLENAVEAQLLQALLEDQGIRCIVEGWHSTPFDGIFEGKKGFGILKVFTGDLERAQAVLEDFRRARPAGEDGEES